ncbi:uncharacterized protein LOC130621265 [Hydractinia symbiolongicarpus]|uniref:uncharacterized protein LOC130621265 n=1 Tax=Hydractinia symbiolongicarpus TaxID=13093 RepID=UPI002549EE04|nr:uncharacterized protein LOC130621265 [Hydractinia symbiolongicarpus]
MNSQKVYAGSSKSRPQKNLSGGFGNYCCIPGCKSALYDSDRKKTNIGLFRIPKQETLRRQWTNVIRNVIRKGGADNFNIEDPKRNYRVCEFHFKTEDIRITLGVGTHKVRRRPPPKDRHIPSSSSSKSEEVISESEESVVVSADQFDGEISQEVTELDILKGN